MVVVLEAGGMAVGSVVVVVRVVGALALAGAAEADVATAKLEEGWAAAVVATGILLVRAVGTAAEVALPAETMASGSVVWVVMVVGAVVAAVMAVEARAWVVRVVGVAVALGL